MKRVMAKFVLQLLLPGQKNHLAVGANDLIQTATNEAAKCLLRRGLECHCPMYNVSYILYLLQ